MCVCFSYTLRRGEGALRRNQVEVACYLRRNCKTRDGCSDKLHDCTWNIANGCLSGSHV